MGEKATLFFFIALAATLVIVALVWQLTAVNRTGGSTAVRSAEDWRLKQLLPAGATVGPVGLVNLDVPAGAAVVGYGLNGRSYLTLLVSKQDDQDQLANTLDLTALDPAFSGDPHVVSRVIGPGASPAIIVRVKGAFDAQAVIFTVVENGRLRPITMRDGGGNDRLAIFYHGYVSEGQEEFSLEDVNGDGKEEAVTRGRYVVHGDGSSGYNTSASVYVWQDGEWQFNKELSWALTARNGLFPEPPGTDNGFPQADEVGGADQAAGGDDSSN